LVPLLRQLLDRQVDQEERDLDTKPCTPDRRRTAWEVGVRIVLSALQVPGIEEADLRELLARMRLDGLEYWMLEDKEGKAMLEYMRGLPLGGVEKSTNLSAERNCLAGQSVCTGISDNLCLCNSQRFRQR